MPSSKVDDPNLAAKRAAALAAVDLIEDGMVVGLGSGSTAAIFIEKLGRRVTSGLKAHGVVTSQESEQLANALGIPLLALDTAPATDIDIDGADEIDPALNLVKGAGGALLHEKLVALSSKRFVIVADESKLVESLGRGPIPVEVVSFYRSATERRLEALGATLALRMAGDEPYVTDSGNNIFDLLVPNGIDAVEFGQRIKSITGVVEHGIFPGLAHEAIIGHQDLSVSVMKPTHA